jgi:type IV pilus assembly protein PilB
MNPRAEHFGADEINLRNVRFTPELLACISAGLARKYRVLPVSNPGQQLRIAVAEPSDIDAIDSLYHFLKGDFEMCVAEASQLGEFIERLYGSESKT